MRFDPRSIGSRLLCSFALLFSSLLVAADAQAADVEINVSSNLFNPPMVVINPGDTVTWTNVQGTHNVNADDGSFRSGDPSPAPWTFSFTFNTPGSFPYHCEVHGGPGGEGMSGLVVVEDEDAMGSIAFTSTSYNVVESSQQAMITLTRSGGSDGDVSIDYATADGTALEGADYDQTSGTLTWLDGEDGPKSFGVPMIDDVLGEGNESFTVSLSNPIGGATVGEPSTATVQILDDDSDGQPCDANATDLCLNEGRFRVRTTWRTPDGESGAGRAIPLTDDTGYFWFFVASNVEVVVKVLDGCPVNDFYWVFAGGLTNVEVTLTVEDTVTGQVMVYQNPVRTAFQPIQDTRAFATCP
ncbi:MAG: Calx-beta domain-containing protein [Acidobacteriota bacterium]|nr:Calx-beta domain-containing protein [Acidobacteriota bacterium]